MGNKHPSVGCLLGPTKHQLRQNLDVIDVTSKPLMVISLNLLALEPNRIGKVSEQRRSGQTKARTVMGLYFFALFAGSTNSTGM